MLAGKLAELDGANNSTPPAGDDSKGMLAHRIRSLQKRAARVSSSGDHRQGWTASPRRIASWLWTTTTRGLI
jgi:hypothetical protein